MLSRIARSLLRPSNHCSIRRFVLPLGEQYAQQLRNQATFSLSSCNKYLVLDDADHDQVQEEKQFHKSKFPLLWLRDNCQCSRCFHPEVNRRILEWASFPFDDLALKSIKVRFIRTSSDSAKLTGNFIICRSARAGKPFTYNGTMVTNLILNWTSSSVTNLIRNPRRHIYAQIIAYLKSRGAKTTRTLACRATTLRRSCTIATARS